MNARNKPSQYLGDDLTTSSETSLQFPFSAKVTQDIVWTKRRAVRIDDKLTKQWLKTFDFAFMRRLTDE